MKNQFNVWEKAVQVAHFVKNLDVYFDTPMTIEREVGAISSACFSDNGHIRQYIATPDAAGQFSVVLSIEE